MADIVVTTAPPVNMTVTTDQTNVNVTQAEPVAITVESGYSTQNLFVGPTQPAMAAPGMWVQTFDDGSWTIWIEDGQ